MMRLRLFVVCVLAAVSASAQRQVLNIGTNANENCSFQIPNQQDALSCDNDLDRGVPAICTAKMVNIGTGACTGHFVAYVGPATLGSVDQASTTGITTVCRPVGLTPLPASPPLLGVSVLESAALCEGDGTVQPGGTVTMSARVIPSITFPPARFRVGVTDNYGGWTGEVVAEFDLANCNLSLTAPPATQSGVPYTASWSAAQSPTTYEIQEATKADFSDAATSTTSSLSQQFTHTVSSGTSTYYYRVRASACRGSQGPYSNTAIVSISAPAAATSKTFDVVVPQGSTTTISQQVHFDGFAAGVPFSAAVDQKFLTVTPATGTTSSTGGVDVTVKADPTALGIGANTGTVTITAAHAKTAGRIATLDGNTQSTPISVSVATPVSQAPKTPPPTSTWIVPAVAHADGIGAQFISDIRLANVNTTFTSSYQLTFTASNSDGTKNGQQTKIDLQPGQVAALNDILHDAFGLATSGTSATGVLEIRALGTVSPGTVASSRTYSVATAGTYGQLVPAIAIDKVATSGGAPLILSHAGQSTAQRMNLGIVESLGFATTGHIRAYNATGQLLADVPYTLRPFEQQQINSFLARNGLTLSSAHIEVSVDPAAAGTTTGGVTAYASMLDNKTNDASVVGGVKAAALTSKRYVLPGVAEGTTVGDHSEVRVLNAGANSADATFTFYPRGASAIIKSQSIAPGEIKNYDNVVASLFGATSSDGSMVVTTPNDSQLLITSRTFKNAANGGSFGMLQTALAPTDGVGSGETAQIVQLEESDKFRTDLGLAELTGAPATVTVKYTSPDSKVSASVDINLNANEYRNETSILSRMSGVTGSTYNGRLTITVSGSGRVAAYGALVDKSTNDPTLLPAQK